MTLFKGHFSLLSWKDSNPRKRNQNPMCYHYTTGQFLIATAKVLLFLLPPRKFPTFFQKKYHIQKKEDNKYNKYKGVCSWNKDNLNNSFQLDIKLLSLFESSLITRYKLDSIVLIVFIVFFL